MAIAYVQYTPCTNELEMGWSLDFEASLARYTNKAMKRRHNRVARLPYVFQSPHRSCFLVEKLEGIWHRDDGHAWSG